MATRQYDIDQSEESFELTETVGGAISDDVRVIIDTAAVTKDEALLLIDKVVREILDKGDWPPA